MQEITREMVLENGSKIYFKAGPIHPFWRINFESGSTPPALSGQYTFFDDAVEAAKRYLEARPARNRTTVTDQITTKKVK